MFALHGVLRTQKQTTHYLNRLQYLRLLRLIQVQNYSSVAVNVSLLYFSYA